MKHKCLKETQKKISPDPVLDHNSPVPPLILRGGAEGGGVVPKGDYLPLYQEGLKGCVPHFSKGGRGGIFKVNVLNNEKGIALFMVLVLSVIMLSITAAVLYMVIEGTQSSGREKRYKTAVEASLGGADVSYKFISTRGNPDYLTPLLTDLTTRTPVVPPNTTCVPSNVAACLLLDDYDATYKGITTKLRLPTSIGTAGDSCWLNCSSTLPIDPNVAATYDMSFKLGTAPDPVYDVFLKIVDTTQGNSAPSTGLVKTGVVLTNSGEITVPKISYLYTIEVLSQSAANPNERARAEVLYAY